MNCGCCLLFLLLFTREAHTNPDVTKFLPLRMAAMDLISIMLANFLVLMMTSMMAVVVAAVATAVAVVVGAVTSIELSPPTFADSMCSWQHRHPISHHCGIRPPIQSFREVCNCRRCPTHGFQKIVAAREKLN